MAIVGNSEVVDLDRQDTWPRQIFDEINHSIPAIAEERAAQNAFDLSSDRWIRTSPPCPRSEEALSIIAQAMTDRFLRVFHATRLVEPITVTVDGLRSLQLFRQISLVRKALIDRNLLDEATELDEAVNNANFSEKSFAIRENQVWFTPMRRFLHDGGCQVFFEHFGGEAIQRLSQSRAALTRAIRTLGDPSVVIGKIPAFGACAFGDCRLAPAMLSLMLEGAGYDFSIQSWDVLLKRDVPAEWIESVLSPSHPDVAQEVV